MAAPVSTLASGLKFAGMLLPVVYCGGMALYFMNVNQGFGGLFTPELGPTIIGLGALTMLFLIGPAYKLIRSIAKGATSSPYAGNSPQSADVGDPGTGFDADDAIARYMARRGETPLVDQPFPDATNVTPPPRFGRKAV